MAVQNALVQISLKGAPSTAVMTTNVTHFAMDVGEVLLGGDPAGVAEARNRAARTLPVIVGFTVGCGLGAACEAALGTGAIFNRSAALIGVTLWARRRRSFAWRNAADEAAFRRKIQLPPSLRGHRISNQYVEEGDVSGQSLTRYSLAFEGDITVRVLNNR